jgi:cytochrome c-L
MVEDLFACVPARLAALLMTASAALLFAWPAFTQGITFRYALDGSPLEVSAKPGEQETEVVKEFKQTGKNSYNGNPEAIEEGKKFYTTYCALCHLPDGSGRMGPSLIDGQHVHERITNDVGLFELIYGGASGAMQPFSKRMTQDEILKTMAYLRTFMK